MTFFCCFDLNLNKNIRMVLTVDAHQVIISPVQGLQEIGMAGNGEEKVRLAEKIPKDALRSIFEEHLKDNFDEDTFGALIEDIRLSSSYPGAKLTLLDLWRELDKIGVCSQFKSSVELTLRDGKENYEIGDLAAFVYRTTRSYLEKESPRHQHKRYLEKFKSVLSNLGVLPNDNPDAFFSDLLYLDFVYTNPFSYYLKDIHRSLQSILANISPEAFENFIPRLETIEPEYLKKKSLNEIGSNIGIILYFEHYSALKERASKVIAKFSNDDSWLKDSPNAQDFFKLMIVGSNFLFLNLGTGKYSESTIKKFLDYFDSPKFRCRAASDVLEELKSSVSSYHLKISPPQPKPNRFLAFFSSEKKPPEDPVLKELLQAQSVDEFFEICNKNPLHASLSEIEGFSIFFRSTLLQRRNDEPRPFSNSEDYSAAEYFNAKY